MKKFLNKDTKNILFIFGCIFIVHCIIWAFSGNSPLTYNKYNSYLLQAQAWRDGSFDLGQDYKHLELAIYDYRYFVSFPPFPSVIYFPFVLLGLPVFEGLFALAFSFAGAAFTYLTLNAEGISEENNTLLTLLFTCGSNLLFVSTNAWVWFIAQNMAYAFTVASLYFAIKKKGTLSFTMLACAVGCRPFNILCFPVICMILISKYKSNVSILFKKYHWYIGAAILALFYMWLNYSRFGNVFEFGHNYLPEFTEAENGQFHLSYIIQNFKSLIRPPVIRNNRMLGFHQHNGMNVFVATPVFALAVYCYFKDIKNNFALKTTASCLIIFQSLLFTAHKTMGGWQFGNRYINDCLPLALVIIAYSYKQRDTSRPLMLMLLYGILINTVGTVLCHLNAL